MSVIGIITKFECTAFPVALPPCCFVVSFRTYEIGDAVTLKVVLNAPDGAERALVEQDVLVQPAVYPKGAALLNARAELPSITCGHAGIYEFNVFINDKHTVSVPVELRLAGG
jgi:hypothetical protein